MRRSPLATLFALFLACGCLAACTAFRFMQGEPGTDLSRVQVGARLEEIEAVLGGPVREWQTSLDVRYRMYSYDAGAPPDNGSAAVMVYLDIASAGFGEIIIAAANAAGDRAFTPIRVRGLLAVPYGKDNRAIEGFSGE
jgi:hypothetical protein